MFVHITFSTTKCTTDFNSGCFLFLFLQWIVLDKLAHLVGDYQSDSDNDDTDQRHKKINNVTTGERICMCTQ